VLLLVGFPAYIATSTMILTNQLINRRREETCVGITSERKYFHAGNAFIKRSLRPSEWQVSPFKGTIHVPRMNNERLLNEAATLQYIRENTNIPVPQLYACFEDDDAVVLVTEYVEGVGMHELDNAQKDIVKKELERHLATLQSLKSCQIGGPSGILIPPYRALAKTFQNEWTLAPFAKDELVFCHNDLSQQNVRVDPETLKITAIVDWEYAGFWPSWCEWRFFERLGSSAAKGDEVDDSARIIELLQSQLVQKAV
jgi:aminoglycoside phosphotransferase (APT) family kinase protein